MSKKREKGKSLIHIPNSYIIFDIETTGLDPRYNEIIEIAAIKIVNNMKVDTFSTLVKPEYEVKGYITKLTGITNEMLNKAPLLNEVLPDFIKFIGEDIIVGHTVNFDINFIYDNSEKLKLPLLKNDFIDTLRLSKKLIPELSSYKLSNLADYFNINKDGNHRALKDVEITHELLNNLREIINKNYENLESYKKLFIPKKRIKLNLKDIKTNNTEFDENNIFYNKNIVITGKLEKMLRREVAQIIVDLGGNVSDKINTKTNYLILGNNDYNPKLNGNKSSKLKKAEELKLKGQDIEILSENIFYENINL